MRTLRRAWSCWCGGGLRTQERVCATYSFLIASPMPSPVWGFVGACNWCRGFSWVGFLLMEAGPSIIDVGCFGLLHGFFVEGLILAQDERWRRA